MGKSIAAAVAVAMLGCASPSSFAAAVLYDGFNYTPGERLVGQTNPSTGAVWTDTTGTPTQPTEPNDTQRILAGNKGYAGLPDAVGNSFSLPNLPNGNMVRLGLPQTYTYDSTSQAGNAPNGVFMSMTVTPTPGATNFLTNNYFAGFSAATPSGGGSTANGYAGQVHLRRNPADTSVFQFGVVKNNTPATIGTPPAGSQTIPTAEIVWSPVPIAADQTALLVFSYNFNTQANNIDDSVSIWVNPTPGEPMPAASATSSTGADVFANNAGVISSVIQSLYYRSNGSPATPSNLVIDELRVGLSYSDVTPIPEPAAAAVLTAAAGVGGLLRRPSRRRRV